MSDTRISHRQMLRAGALGGLGLAAPGLVTARVDPNRSIGSGATLGEPIQELFGYESFRPEWSAN